MTVFSEFWHPAREAGPLGLLLAASGPESAPGSCLGKLNLLTGKGHLIRSHLIIRQASFARAFGTGLMFRLISVHIICLFA